MNKDLEELFSVMMQLKQAFYKLCQFPSEDRTATFLQYSALSFLSSHPENTMSALASYLRLSLSSATQLIERSVKLGLVVRVDDKQDRRIVHLVITDAGQKELNVMQKRMHEKMAKIFSKIPQKDLREYIRIQKMLLENLQKEENESC